MTSSYETTPEILPKSDKAFNKLYNRLDGLATKIGGKAWLDDQLFDVETMRVIKRPISEEGIVDRDCYVIETYEFTGSKFPTGDDEDPFFNVFKVAQTQSSPIKLQETDPAHRTTLIGHFFTHFSELMYSQITAFTQTDEDEEITYIDSVDIDVQFDACELIIKQTGLDVRLGRTILYHIIENGQVIDYEEESSYEIGDTKYQITHFGSTEKEMTAVHHEEIDTLAEEFVVLDHETPSSLLATNPFDGDVGNKILVEDAFFQIVDGVFDAFDHGGTPYLKHVKNIRHLLKQFKNQF